MRTPLVILDASRNVFRRHPHLGELWNTIMTEGGILLRNPATTRRDFVHLTELLATRFRIHHDPTRVRFDDCGRTQSTTGGHGAVRLHAERTYLPDRPELLFFWCIRPAAEGGQTVLCDGAHLLASLSQPTRRFLERTRLVFRSTLSRQTWQEQLQVATKGAAISSFKHLLARTDEKRFTAFWFVNDSLVIEYQTACTNHSWISGRQAFANYLLQAHSVDTITFSGIGQMQASVFAEIQDAAASFATHLTMAQGDILILDNTRMLHGRTEFSDPKRLIATRMGDVRQSLRFSAGPPAIVLKFREGNLSNLSTFDGLPDSGSG